MKRKKLIAALMLCCVLILPAKADDITIDQGISGATNGALTNASGNTMTITNGLSFTDNKGDVSGGVYNLGELIIEDGTKDNHTTFSGNSVTSPWGGGGAIYSYATGSSIDIGNFTSFENNTTANVSNGNSGGAIYAGDAILNIGDNVNFSGNAAATSGFGGALYIQNTTTTIGDSFNVSGNSAKFGGGIAINNNKGEAASIGSGSIFSGNRASNGNGGAISSESTNFTIGSGARFESNEASANGGAIAVSQFGGDAGKVTIGDGAQFINNVAKNGNGGAIYNTTNVEIQGGTFTGNSATLGGAIYNATGGSMSLANVTFNAEDSNGSNSIYSDGFVVTSSTGNNINTFNSDITINHNWEFGGNNTVGGNIDGTGAITNTGSTTFAGNNSQFTGSFTQSDSNAETTVTGTFFGGTSTVSNGTLNWKTQTGIPSGGSLNITDGNLNLLSGSKLTIGSGSSIEDAVNLNIAAGSELTLAQAELNLTNADTWDGMIRNENGGIINADGLVNNSDTASLIQEGGELNVYNDAHLTLGEGSEITGSDINITKGANGKSGSSFTLTDGTIEGGNMTIDKDSSFIVKNGTFNLDSISGAGEVDADGVMHASLVDVANGQRVQHSIKELAIDTQTNFNMDIHARGNHYTSNDQFIVTNLTGDGIARIDDWSLNGDILGWDAPIDRHIVLDHIFVDQDGNPLQGNIEVTDKTQFTPIGWYQLNQKGSGAGLHYTLDLVKYNPEVYRGQVTTVAQWMNQLAIDDMLFTHSMVLPSFKEEDGGVAYSGIMANRYAASNPLFAPYQYSRKDGGLWYKMYGTFENLNMNLSGLGRVGNNAYGALIGADFGLKELKNGWKFMPTAYVGYNGAHQAYPGVGAYQNGGQAGFLGTWYKNNFIIGGLVYGGVYENSMDVAGHTDNAFNYFAGAATKFAYNWRFHRDWVLQPNLMAAYNFFGQQNWHSDYGQMGMMAGMLHGANIAPGVNLIWEKETFSIYGTLQYMYNVNGAVGGRAGNVGLPQVEMERGYIQYGLGFTKKWGDRFSGYLQAVLRNVGRTGVGFQMGFNILLGK